MGTWVVCWGELLGQVPVQRVGRQEGRGGRRGGARSRAVMLLPLWPQPRPGELCSWGGVPRYPEWRRRRGLGLCSLCIDRSLHMSCSGRGRSWGVRTAGNHGKPPLRASGAWSMRLILGVRAAHAGIHSPGYVTLLGLFTCRMGTMLHFSPSLPRLEYFDQMIQSRYNSSSRLWTVCCVPGCA